MKTMKARIGKEESGQALVELAFAFVLLCTFVFGIIDFGRAIYDVEVMKNLVGEGSSMASRGTPVATAANTVANDAGADLNISTLGCVIITAVTNDGGGALDVTAQAQTGGIACNSKVGCVIGTAGCGNSKATLPAGAVTALNAEPTGSSIYVTEIFYNYNTITPVTAFLGKNVVPSQLYSAAYY
jgi:Flp pilus assembly protein TadG